ncbi:hypothetical protein M413DRAFT_438361 [Hebeloma cylindrosporum]|uniref:Uncharacterized protein n=1 Tax=Hebeloma cylindrosporum TaxID=76867 RepID=A0A0C3CZD6_HEBCY|nr:hypothetical protein M413DRAFT_438361 [Hebeloma cylindrosporum h7]
MYVFTEHVCYIAEHPTVSDAKAPQNRMQNMQSASSKRETVSVNSAEPASKRCQDDHPCPPDRSYTILTHSTAVGQLKG